MVCFIVCAPSLAQQTNPIERQVQDPLTETPDINPLNQELLIRPTVPVKKPDNKLPGDELKIDADKQTVTGTKGAHVVVYEGNVDVHIGGYRLQADKVTDYEARTRVVAEGNVVLDQSDLQRITGTRAEWDYQTKTGFFVNSTGYTNHTQDGTRLYFTADRVERVSLDTIVVINAQITACDENVPKWSFRAKRATIKTGDRARFKSPTFRVKNVPVLYLPYASVSIEKEDRSSGFLAPTFSGSGSKGFRLSTAYYQTLGRSADLTILNDVYSQRGLGFGADFRTRFNSRSFLNAGFFAVKDRIFGPKESAQNPDQGGAQIFVNGVHYFPNGFIAAADVNYTTNLAFRQVFSDNIQQVIQPEELSQVFLNKNSGDYSFNFLARSRTTFLPQAQLTIRELPSVTLDKRPSILSYLDRLPVYYSFEGGLEGVSRTETPNDPVAFRAQVRGNPIVTPGIVQRLDFHPRVSVPIDFNGWTLTATGGVRATYYSNSIDPSTRLVLGRDLVRGYGEFEFEVRPPALARNFSHGDGSFFFRHVIEPYIIYRKIGGIKDFDRTILFDYVDTIADTNELEYGITNRFFTRRSKENIGNAAKRVNKNGERVPVSSQPFEALTVTLRGKYFFDPYFGGALVPGQRNQFYPINTLSGFTYGGVPRRFSPVSLEARYRPTNSLFADVRTDLDLQNFGVRAYSTSFGIYRPLIQAFETFYYTRAISLIPSLSRFADASGKEAGTLNGSQLSPTVFLGNRSHGLFGGASIIFDFQKRANKNSSLVSSTVTVGYTWDCCAVTVQNFTFDVGLRKENRIVFAFKLNGIGTFGTQQLGRPR